MFWRRKEKTAVLAEPAGPRAEDYATTDEILDEITSLTAEHRDRPDPELPRRILRLRHLAGMRLLSEAAPGPQYPAPDSSLLPDGDLPEVSPEDLTPELLRAAILSSGCLLIRGVMDPTTAEGLANGIERAFSDREAHDAGASRPEPVYELFQPEPGLAPLDERPWIAEGGGVLAADAPSLVFEMLDSFERAGLSDLISSYLGEPATISAQKSTLRKAEPAIPGAWHQDGSFLGDVRALNVWLSLSRCGDLSPGLDVLPRRLDDLVATGTHNTMLSYQIAPEIVEEAANGTPIVRPIFEPGDVLLFDELFLHQTGSDPSMPNPRYAIESWFFGASAFPADYAPLAA